MAQTLWQQLTRTGSRGSLRDNIDSIKLNERHSQEIRRFWEHRGYATNERPDPHGVKLGEPQHLLKGVSTGEHHDI